MNIALILIYFYYIAWYNVRKEFDGTYILYDLKMDLLGKLGILILVWWATGWSFI